MYEALVKLNFTDLQDNVYRKVGEIYTIKTCQRLKELAAKEIVEPIGLHYRGNVKKRSGNIYIFAKRIGKIGGIETAIYHLVKSFPNKKFTVICEGPMDFEQVSRLSRYCSVQRDMGFEYECDVAILNQYDTSKNIIDRIKAKKIYHFCHADWNGLKSLSEYFNLSFEVSPKVDKIIAVSETCQKGLKDTFGYDSVVVPNIFNPDEEQPIVFLCLSRGGSEKGIDKVVAFAKKCEEYAAEHDKTFTILLTTDSSSALARNNVAVDGIPEIVKVQPTIYSSVLLRSADYLLQLSDNESYGYSPREAMANGVVPICTRIPEFEKLIKDGENGYLVEKDLSDLDLEKIFSNKIKNVSYSEPINPLWNDLLSGRL